MKHLLSRLMPKKLTAILAVAAVFIAGLFLSTTTQAKGKPPIGVIIVCANDINNDVSDSTEIIISADSQFMLTAVYVSFTATDGDEDAVYRPIVVISDPAFPAIGLGFTTTPDPVVGSHAFELLRGAVVDVSALAGDSLFGLTAVNVRIGFEITAGTEDDDEILRVSACGWIAQRDKDSFEVIITD